MTACSAAQAQRFLDLTRRLEFIPLYLYHAPLVPRTILLCLFAWLVPGGGHLLLKKWGRAVLFCAVVIALFCLGLSMDGRLFELTPGFFGFLKFFADLSIGLPYLLGKWAGWGVGDIHSFGYEYGNTYIYTAGLLNMLVVLDTFDIAEGRRS